MFRKLIIVLITVLISGFNANAGSDGELIIKKNQPAEIKDCFESVNRVTFAFNQALDGAIFKPVASAYRVLPSPVKSGVSNSIENLSNLVTIPNNLLQGELKKAGINSGRFIINTTFGILGLINVAEYLGFPEYEKEDYGQSLATMGVGPGCYLVLPVLGPSTVRDATASVANLVGQIQKRGRDYENSIRIDYLTRLNERYEAWISQYNRGKLLIIDVDDIDFENNKEDLGSIISRIDGEINGLF